MTSSKKRLYDLMVRSGGLITEDVRIELDRLAPGLLDTPYADDEELADYLDDFTRRGFLTEEEARRLKALRDSQEAEALTSISQAAEALTRTRNEFLAEAFPMRRPPWVLVVPTIVIAGAISWMVTNAFGWLGALSCCVSAWMLSGLLYTDTPAGSIFERPRDYVASSATLGAVIGAVVGMLTRWLV